MRAIRARFGICGGASRQLGTLGMGREGVLRIPLVLLVVDPAGAEGELFLHVLEEFVAEVVDAD